MEDGFSSPGKAFSVMTSLVPGIAHRLQLCQYVEVRSFLWEAQAQYGSYLRGELSHQDVLGITTDVPGIVTDVLGITTNVLGVFMDVLGVVTDVLSIATNVFGDIMDFPRSIVRSLLYRNLAERSAKITTSRISSSYSVIRGVWHLPACVPSSNGSAIAGRVTGVVECGAAGSRRGSKRPGISSRREPRHNEVDGRIGLVIDLTLRMSMINNVGMALVNTLGFDPAPSPG